LWFAPETGLLGQFTRRPHLIIRRPTMRGFLPTLFSC